jgi:hypothetical protein
MASCLETREHAFASFADSEGSALLCLAAAMG